MKTIIKFTGCQLILMIVLLAAGSSSVFANEYYDTGRFDVTVSIGTDAKCRVNERINLLFSHSQNGIRRALPTDRGVYRTVNGKDIVENEHVVYRDFSASGNEVHTQTDNKQLMAYVYGDAPVSGYQSYSLSYTRDAGDNGHADFDDLILPVLPYTWDDDISEGHFKITLPEAVDPKCVAIYAGEHGAKDGAGVSYIISGKNITGHITKVLGPCEGVTMVLRVPKGYFKGAATGRNFLIPDAVLSILGCLAAYLLIRHFQKQQNNAQLSDKAHSVLSRHDYRAQTAFRLRSIVMMMALIASLGHAWAMMYAALRSFSPVIGLTIWLFAALLPVVIDAIAVYLFFKYKDNETALIWFVLSAIAALLINLCAIIFCYTIIHTVVVPAMVYAGFLALGFAYAFFTKSLRPFRKGQD